MEINRKTRASLALILTFSIALTLFASVLSDPGLGEFRWLGDTNLALCGQPEDNSQWDILISWGISSCINMRSGTPEDDVPHLLSQGLTYYHLPTTDWDISPEETHAGVQWINEQLADGRKVLIHCNHGTSRTPTMAAMWYIHEGHTAQEALAWIQSYPPSYPSEMATQAMLDYYDWLHSEDPDPPENTGNLLVEPSVETVYHWTSGKTSGMIAILEHSSDAHTGDKGIKISSTYNQNGGQLESAYWFQTINNPVSGKTYSFKTWYKSNIESTILFLAYHRNSNESYVVSLNLPPSENWKQSSCFDVTMPSNANVFRIDCRLFNRNTGYVIFDDLELHSIIPETPEEPEPTPEPEPESPEPEPTPALTTNISISVDVASTVVGSAVNVKGKITDINGSVLQDSSVTLLYSIEGKDWVPIGLGITNAVGEYKIQWVNTASGTFTLKAEWKGNDYYLGASNTTTLGFLPYQNQNFFVVESNSTVSALTFNETNAMLSFTVSGSTGTTGYVRAAIPKDLLDAEDNWIVLVDDNPITPTVDESTNNTYLYFTYDHSTATVEIFGTNAIPEFPSRIILPLFLIATLVIIIHRSSLRRKLC